MLNDLSELLPESYGGLSVDVSVQKTLFSSDAENSIYDIFVSIDGLSDLDNEVNIAEIHLKVVPNWILNEDDAFIIFDNVSQELSNLASGIGLVDKLNPIFEDFLMFDDLIYVNRLKVNKDLRNKKIGGCILHWLKHIVDGALDIDTELIFLHACPYEFVETDKFNEMKLKLVNFYKRAGFEILDDNYTMYKIYTEEEEV